MSENYPKYVGGYGDEHDFDRGYTPGKDLNAEPESGEIGRVLDDVQIGYGDHGISKDQPSGTTPLDDLKSEIEG